MPDISATFMECIQDSQEFGSDDEHMVSRVWVEISVDGKHIDDYIVDLKQTVGGAFDEIEVGPPRAVVGQGVYSGPFDHAAFRAAVVDYFLGLVGPKGRGIRIEDGKNIRMQHNRFIAMKTVTFPAAGPPGTVW